MTRTTILFPTLCYSFQTLLSNYRRSVNFCVLLFLFGISGVCGTDFLAEGEKALSRNDLAKAQTYLEAALAQGPASEKLYLELGLAYQKLSMPAEARKMFKKGADLEGPSQYLLAYNLAISAYSLKDYEAADAACSTTLTLRPNFSDALLNRANTRLQLKNWQGAVADFTLYQKQEPTNPQKEKIDQVLALLNKVQSDEEAKKLAEIAKKKQEEEDRKAAELAKQQDDAKKLAELAAKKAEEDRLAAEEKKKQEEILAKIRDSLQGVSDDAKALTTGPAGVKSEDGDFSLDQ